MKNDVGSVGGRAGLAEPLVDVTVELGLETESAEALRELNPGETGVVAGAAELDVGDGLRIVFGEDAVDRVVDELLGGSDGRHSASLAESDGGLSAGTTRSAGRCRDVGRGDDRPRERPSAG